MTMTAVNTRFWAPTDEKGNPVIQGGKPMLIELRGFWIAIRKEILPDTRDGIVIPDLSRGLHTFAEVLAIGPQALDSAPRDFRTRPVHERQALKAAGRIDLSELECGDSVLYIPNHPWAIMLSPYGNTYEGLIDPVAIIAINKRT